MSDIAIKVDNVSKRFKLFHNPVTGPLKELLFFWKRHQYYQQFMAVKNVNMEIKKGEVVGIIGVNGAGKTTLLKMIAGLLPVDQGKIQVYGKVTALLALGIGINPEFTGRENIFYSGLLLGMSKEEIKYKMESIIEFAEIGNFIDLPLRTYSSGMRARLLFAISMSIDPDILIVDEALATGDSYFVEKSSQRIRELCQSGATIIFVSHNLFQIQQLCNRAYLMDHGEIVAQGIPDDIVSEYYRNIIKNQSLACLIHDENRLNLIGGNGDMIISSITIKDKNGEITNSFSTGTSLRIELKYRKLNPQVRKVHLFCGFIDVNSMNFVAETFTRYYVDINSMSLCTNFSGINTHDSGVLYVEIEPLCLFNGQYSIWIIVYDAESLTPLCEYKDKGFFYVGVEVCANRKDIVCTLPVKEWGYMIETC